MAMAHARSLIHSLLVALGATLAVTGCQGGADAPAKAPSLRTAAIVNGQVETGWPGVGALTLKFGVHYGGAYCTGTLIAPSWVMTAGHCTTGPDFQQQGIIPSNTFFYVGNDARPTRAGAAPTEGTFYAVDAFVPHPNYDDVTNRNDIGLVHLAEPVPDVPTYAFATTSLAAYAEANKPVELLYIGFGATEGIRESGAGLKRSTRFAITAVASRTFNSDYVDTGTCFGDSGGPNILELDAGPVIVGLTSAGDACSPINPNCDPCQTETISTRVDAFASWITSTLGGPAPTCLTVPVMCLCAEGCLADGTCDVTQCHVADCPDTYQCVMACAEDACREACFFAATPSAQAEAQTLVARAEEKCATFTVPDEHRQCLRDECRIPYNVCTGFGPTTTGDATCEEVYRCVDDCSTFQCVTQCENQGTASAQTDVSALLRCLHENCRNVATEADYMTCADESCGPEISVCIPPATGDATCQAVDECATACDGDASCEGACRATGTAAAQAAWDALTLCRADHCTGMIDEAVTACTVASCAIVAITCTPGSIGPGCDPAGGDCPAGTACAGTPPTTACLMSAGKAEGESCTPESAIAVLTECADGLVCQALGDASGTCLPVCVDADGDGGCADEDCDDVEATTHPGAVEICGDAIDNDCDQVVDNGCAISPPTPAAPASGCEGGGGGRSLGFILGLLGLVLMRPRLG